MGKFLIKEPFTISLFSPVYSPSNLTSKITFQISPSQKFYNIEHRSNSERHKRALTIIAELSPKLNLQKQNHLKPSASNESHKKQIFSRTFLATFQVTFLQVTSLQVASL